MKNLISILFIVISTVGLAQENKKFRIKTSFGYSISNDVDLYRLSIEPNYRIRNNSKIGLKLMYSEYSREPIKSTFETPLQLEIPPREVDGYFHGAITYDYFVSNQGKISPYFGLGLGLFPTRDILLTEQKSDFGSHYISNVNYENKNLIGFIFRGGIEWWKLLLEVEYNLIGNSTRKLQSKTYQETNRNIENSSLNINVGFIIGGGKMNTKESD